MAPHQMLRRDAAAGFALTFIVAMYSLLKIAALPASTTNSVVDLVVSTYDKCYPPAVVLLSHVVEITIKDRAPTTRRFARARIGRLNVSSLCVFTRNPRGRNNPRHWRTSTVWRCFSTSSDRHFIRKFRMDKDTFNYLHETLETKHAPLIVERRAPRARTPFNAAKRGVRRHFAHRAVQWLPPGSLCW